MTPFRLNRRAVLAAATATAAWLSCGVAVAQSGSAPLRVILPLSAGSAVDAIVRSAQNALSRALGGQTVVIENLPGAGGITGAQAIVRAAADGNTVGFISNNYSVNPSVFKNMPYDSLNDITPISVVGGSPFVLVVNPAKVAARSVKDMQALLRSKPGAFNMASSGNGTIIHLAGEMFVDALGVQVQHIPYKGMAPMVSDIVSGQVDFGVVAVTTAQGHLASGRLKAIGVMGRQRVPSLPDVPTVVEQGFPEVDVAGWFAMVAPKGLPAPQVKRLHDAVVTAFNDPDVKAAMARQDNFITPTTPDAAAKFLRSEQERYARLVAKANIKID